MVLEALGARRTARLQTHGLTTALERRQERFTPAQGDVRESGEPRPSTVTLSTNKCLGTISSATGTAPEGSWAFYKGEDPSGGALLDRVIARVKERSATGRVITAFRVRQQGLDPNYDCFCTANFIRRKWPGQAEDALKSFYNQARIMDGA